MATPGGFHAATNACLPWGSKRIRFVASPPSTIPNSSQTHSNTSVGSGSRATRVATRRSAACSSRRRCSCSRASLLASASATSSAKLASRFSAPGANPFGRPLEATSAPHSLPATVIGAPDRRFDPGRANPFDERAGGGGVFVDALRSTAAADLDRRGLALERHLFAGAEDRGGLGRPVAGDGRRAVTLEAEQVCALDLEQRADLSAHALEHDRRLGDGGDHRGNASQRRLLVEQLLKLCLGRIGRCGQAHPLARVELLRHRRDEAG